MVAKVFHQIVIIISGAVGTGSKANRSHLLSRSNLFPTHATPGGSKCPCSFFSVRERQISGGGYARRHMFGGKCTGEENVRSPVVDMPYILLIFSSVMLSKIITTIIFQSFTGRCMINFG